MVHVHGRRVQRLVEPLRKIPPERWALRCTRPQASDTILGQGWATAGYNAADLDPACPGVGWLLAEGGQPVRLRSHLLDDTDIDQLARRATAIRADVAEHARPGLQVVQ